MTGLISSRVAALTEGVLNAMLLSQARAMAAALLMAGLIGLGLGMQVETAEALESRAIPGESELRGGEGPPQAPPSKPASPGADLERLQGIWFGTVTESGGKPLRGKAGNVPPQVKLVVEGDQGFLRGPKFAETVTFGSPEDSRLTLKLAVAEGRKTIDLTCSPGPDRARPLTYRGIYVLTNERFEVCLDLPGRDRPEAFKTRPESSQLVIVLRPARIQDNEPQPSKRLR